MHRRTIALYAAAAAGIACAALPGSAATPSQVTVKVPAIGHTATVHWSGTINPGADASSDCTQAKVPPDVAKLAISVPKDFYRDATAKFAFSITWTPLAKEDANDEILTVVKPGGSELDSSDGGSTTESVIGTDLAGGLYQAEACGFANSTPQSYQGTLKITSLSRPKPMPLPKQRGPRVSFGVPRIVDPIHSFGEPDIKVGTRPNASGHSYPVTVSGPAGTGTQRSVWDISTDGGDSYRMVQDIAGEGQAPAELPSKETYGPGGGDTEVIYDHTGKAYFADLYALDCYTVATTADNGKAVHSNANGCSRVSSSADRQWYGLFDPQKSDHTVSPYTGPKPLLYMTYTGDAGAQLDKSADGLNFTDAGSHDDNQDSPLVVDQHTGDVIAAVAKGGHLGLAVGTPDKAGNLAFTENLSNADLPGGVGTLFPVIAQDADRNVYIAYVPNCSDGGEGGKMPDNACFHVYYMWASAKSHWSSFHGPYRVDMPDRLTHDDTTVMPWAIAGHHTLDVVWYGTPKRMDPSYTESAHGRPWYVYMSQVTHADGAKPTFSEAQASPHPMHYNSICLNGLGCIASQGDRNLADFFQVTLDPRGRARIVYCDSSNGLEQPGFQPGDGLLDHSGGESVTTVTQQNGVNARTGRRLRPTETTAPMQSLVDPSRDSLVNKPLGGTYAKGADITFVGLSKSGSNLKIKVLTGGSSLGSAAQQADAAFGQMVIRWQMGDTLYYAEVEQDAGGGTTEAYAGKVGSIDLCSVSACDPHYFTYPGAAAGGNSVPVTATIGSQQSTYTITVPLADIGSPTDHRLLEEVAAYVFAAPQSANVTPTNAQAEAEQGIPIEIEGTKTINYTLAAKLTYGYPHP